MSDSKKPTVSEIRARDEDMQGEESLAKFIFHARTDIPYLLDLVERMGDALRLLLIQMQHEGRHGNSPAKEEARALVVESKQ